MAERADFSEKHETVVIAPTPSEAEFANELKRRFNITLSEPFVDSDYDLVRGSIPVLLGQSHVVFQYRRFDVARTHIDQVIQAYEFTYPSKGFPKDRDIHEDHEGTPWEDIYALANFYDSGIEVNMLALEAIRTRIESDGGYDAKAALSNPNYYIPNRSITQFPEVFEASVFTQDDDIELNRPTTLARRHGKVNDKRPDIYATLQFGPKFVDYTPKYKDKKSDYPPDYDDHVVIRFPKLELVTHTAYVSAFQPASLNLGRGNGLELDDISFFPHSRPLSHRIRMNDSRSVMKDFTSMVSGLAKS